MAKGQNAMPILKKTVQDIERNPLAWVVQTAGVLLFVGNLYLGSQLFPLIRNIDSLVARVGAIETSLDGREELVHEFRQLQQAFADKKETDTQNFNEIKSDLREIKQLIK